MPVQGPPGRLIKQKKTSQRHLYSREAAQLSVRIPAPLNAGPDKALAYGRRRPFLMC